MKRGEHRVTTAEEPIAGYAPTIPPEVLAASEAFRLHQDALRWRWIKAHRGALEALKFVPFATMNEWIDQKRRENP